MSGQYDKTDGWIKNEYPGVNEDTGRKNNHNVGGYLLFTQTDRLRVRLAADNSSDTIHSLNEQLLSPGFTLEEFERDMTKHSRMDIETNEEVKTNAQNLKISYDFNSFKLESITTHRVRDLYGIYDSDRSAGTVFDGLITFRDGELATWTEELRLNSVNTTGTRWVGGVYLDKDENQIATGLQMPGIFMGSPVNMEIQSVADTDSRTQAIFGQFMMPLGQSFEVTVGGRYQRFNKKMHQSLYFLPVTGPRHSDPTGMIPSSSIDLDKTWNTFLPKAALAWFISDKYTTYASFSQGYMPGGFNYFSMSGGADENTFEPQKSTNYEIGIKADHDTWWLNMTAFYMDITDVHIYKSVGNLSLADNADKAHSLGIEIEAAWMPFKGLELSMGGSLMEALYDDYDLGNKKLDGENMEGTPNHSLHFSINYHLSSGLYSRANVRHVGNVHYYDDAAKDLQKVDAYTLVDIRLGWLQERWDVYAFAHNLFDEEYINNFSSSPILGGLAGFGDPFSIGIGLSYNF